MQCRKFMPTAVSWMILSASPRAVARRPAASPGASLHVLHDQALSPADAMHEGRMYAFGHAHLCFFRSSMRSWKVQRHEGNMAGSSRLAANTEHRSQETLAPYG